MQRAEEKENEMERKDLIHLWIGWFIPRNDDYCINVHKNVVKPKRATYAYTYSVEIYERAKAKPKSRSHNVNDDKTTMTMTVDDHDDKISSCAYACIERTLLSA